MKNLGLNMLNMKPKLGILHNNYKLKFLRVNHVVSLTIFDVFNGDVIDSNFLSPTFELSKNIFKLKLTCNIKNNHIILKIFKEA